MFYFTAKDYNILYHIIRTKHIVIQYIDLVVALEQENSVFLNCDMRHDPELLTCFIVQLAADNSQLRTTIVISKANQNIYLKS